MGMSLGGGIETSSKRNKSMSELVVEKTSRLD